ncbi:MAG: hypothetical protein PHW96_02045 [Candidatus Nanoarchaeia archaeon]|nr:hypothetical protein [Candidatus Nanoarchaeia archaeon]
MEISENAIVLDKEINKLDKFVIDFTKILDKLKINYSVVSGYVSILLGRSRATEDVDILIPRLGFDKFEDMWNNLTEFECMTINIKEAYETLKNGSNIRFFRKDVFIPNMEVKFSKNELDEYTLNNSFEVKIKDYKIKISPLHLQIPFKLFLGSQKDIEDARHIYQLVKDKLDKEKLQYFTEKLKVSHKLKLIQ